MTEVYYIEDDENIAMIVKKYLEQKGCAVSIFQTLSEGKHSFECHVPGIVLIDWNMPDGSGNVFCQWVRSKWKEIPIFF